MIYFILYVILIFSVFHIVNAKMYDEDEFINPDFILRSDLMPSSLLMMDSDYEKIVKNNTYERKKTDVVGFNGSWFDAYNTMKFHRTMFNEYLCRNFVVKEILSEMQTPVLSRRIGRPFVKAEDVKHKKKEGDPSNKRKSRTRLNDVNDDLLSDPGSSNYRNWLAKTTTLEDVYRHYDMTVSKNPDDVDRDDSLDYETGDFTGYAEPSPSNAVGKNDFQPPSNYYSNFVPSSYPQGNQQNMDTDKHGDYDFTPQHIHFHSSEESEKSSHGMVLNDLFDIALTAIAFLSFGMFILQVIMCITMNKPMMAMMPMTDVDPDVGGEITDEMRFKRHAMKQSHPLNDLARRVLVSIETGLAAEQDKGACLKWALCENNKYSRSFKDKQRFWIPVWGLGMSWLSSRFIESSHIASIMLESLRACALGLGQIDCSSTYSCNLRHLLESRRNSFKWNTTPS